MQKPTFTHSYYGDGAPIDMGIGLITDCNPAGFTVDVQMETGAKLNNIPIMNLYGSPMGNDLTWLTSYRGATAAIIKLGGQHYVLGTMPVQFSHTYSDDDKTQISSGKKKALDTTYAQDLLKADFGGSDTNYQKTAVKDFHGGRPMDLLPGDKVLSNDVGSSIGIFKEGLVRLKASPLAQLIFGKYKDFCRLVARRFQGYFDFGEINISSDDKGTALSIKGGASYGSETAPGTDKWTVQMFMGNYVSDTKTDLKKVGEFDAPKSENSRFFMRVNDSGNAEYTGFMMDTGGNITITTSKTGTETNLEHRNIEVGKNETRYIGKDRFIKVGENEKHYVGKDRLIDVTGTERHYVGSDKLLEVDNDEGISIAGDSTKTVSGKWTDNCARERNIVVVGPFSLKSDTMITIKAPFVNIVRGIGV